MLTRYLSVAAAAGVIAAVLVGAELASSGDPAPTEDSNRPPAAAAPQAPGGLSFTYGEKLPGQRIDAPRVGICYPFEGDAPSAFRNDTDLAAQLYPAPDCGGEPGVLLSPGERRTGTAAGRGVVFVVPAERAG
ncbi:hypothetical protein [Streptomyces zingiberis]|uniref:Uncharacterized protein n=1 Tax=Streptomyces zingiberis TaxID=2053010 RepID=A0ABX1BR73_9ACTN|nr:hypothetical protein [Streptomyces zingiberis]NJQ00231.1 hypothetical protein [Streptomyces zingiberis]